MTRSLAKSKGMVMAVGLAAAVMAFWLMTVTQEAEAGCWYAQPYASDSTGNQSIPGGGTAYGKSSTHYNYLYSFPDGTTGMQSFYCRPRRS